MFYGKLNDNAAANNENDVNADSDEVMLTLYGR